MVKGTPPGENPLRRWRKSQKMTVLQCVEGSGFSAVSWYQWEAWPDGSSARYPSPGAMRFIRKRTSGAVTPNDFDDVQQDEAA